MPCFLCRALARCSSGIAGCSLGQTAEFGIVGGDQKFDFPRFKFITGECAACASTARIFGVAAQTLDLAAPVSSCCAGRIRPVRSLSVWCA